MNDELWSELEMLTATLERLRRELSSCQGASEYRDYLQAEITAAQRRRQEILAELQER